MINAKLEGHHKTELAIGSVRAIPDRKLAAIVWHVEMIFVKRAKEIITDKGHIITGSLRRSIRAIVKQMVAGAIEGRIGSHLHYAYYVEALPDGGYLFQALTEKWDCAMEYLTSRINAEIKRAAA